MKKIFSLFLSLILIFSMTVSNVVFVEAAAASNDGAKLIKVLNYYDFDTNAVTIHPTSNSNIYTGGIGLRLYNNKVTANRITTIGSDSNVVFKFPSGTRTDGDRMYVNFSNTSTETVYNSGEVSFSGEFYNHGISSGYITVVGEDTSVKQLYGAECLTGVGDNIVLSNGVWYDFEYRVNLDEDMLYITYSSTSNGHTEVQTRTQAFAGGVKKMDVRPAFSGLTTEDPDRYFAWDNLMIASYPGTKVSSILSVNDGNEVPARTKNLTFTMSEDIPTLSDGDITATPLGGGATCTATSWTVTSDGSNYIVNADFDQRFTENKTYNLAINSDVYAGYKALNADGSIGDVDTSGLTDQFTVGDYTIDTTTGTGVLVNTVYDTVGKTFSDFNKVSEFTDSNNYQAKYIDGSSSVILNGINFCNTVRTNIDGAVAVQRLNKASADRDMYVTFSNPLGSEIKGKYTITGKFFTNKAKTDDPSFADFSSTTIGINRKSGKYDASHTVTGILANEWYEFKYEVEIGVSSSGFGVTYTKVGDSTPTYYQSKTYTTNKFNSIRADMDLSNAYTSFDSTGYYELYKDLKMEFTALKSKILSVNSDAAVAPNQNQLTFTISNPIPGLEANPDWVVVEDASGNENVATAVTVAGNASPYTVTATLTEPLAAWADYTLKLDEDIYAGYGEINADGDLIDPVLLPDSEFTKVFSVASTGFDMREKFPVASDADSVDYVMEYTNTSSSCPPVTLLLPVYSADGIMQHMEAVTLSDLPINSATKEASISAAFEAGLGAKLFAINGWSGKVPHFGKSWNVDATNKTLEAFSSAEPITVSDFDYDNFKVNVGVVASDAQVSGVLYVYEESATLSDSVKPIYVDYLTSASDGTFTVEIPFKDTIDDATPDNGATYKVEFYAPGITPVSGTFTVYDADAIQAQKEAAILAAAKSAGTVAALRHAILGINDIEQVVNDNFEVFDVQADTDTHYKNLSNKEAVFSKMFDQKSLITDYASLVSLFETCASKQAEEENTPTYNPSTDNSSYGGSSVVVKDTPAVSTTPSQPQGSTAVDASAFADMSGHWASEFATELSKRGIMNGYPDGSFKGENSITRAELAKTLVEAIGIETGEGSAFSDVASGAWYAPYIAGASAAGVINGFENGTFAPDVNVNRQDAVLMLYRAMKLVKDLPVGYTFFTDDFDIQDYASDAVRCLGDLGIVKGDPDVKFNPLNNITRAEVATIICRALDYIESH